MNAKEGGAMRPGALGRGLDTLMGDEQDRKHAGERDGQPAPQKPAEPTQGREAPNGSATRSAPDRDRALDEHAGLVGGLIASGAAGAIIVAAFSLLGVKAVLSMTCTRRC